MICELSRELQLFLYLISGLQYEQSEKQKLLGVGAGVDLIGHVV